LELRHHDVRSAEHDKRTISRLPLFRHIGADDPGDLR